MKPEHTSKSECICGHTYNMHNENGACVYHCGDLTYCPCWTFQLCAVRKTAQDICGAIIHVGFDGATTCANPKEGCVMHDPEARKKAMDEFFAGAERAGEILNKKDSPHSEIPPPQSHMEWEEEFDSMFKANSLNAVGRESGYVWPEKTTLEFVKPFIYLAVKRAYERGVKDEAEEWRIVRGQIRKEARAERTKEIVEMVKGMLNHNEMLENESREYTNGFERFRDVLIIRLEAQS